MDAHRFDALVRAITTPGTRRRLLAGLTGLPLVGFLAIAREETPVTARGRKAHRHHAHPHLHRTKTQRQDQHKDAHSDACIPTGQRCPSKKPRGKKGKKLDCNKCCQGNFVTDTAGKKVCGCQPNGGTCTTSTASTCCSGFCNGSTCQAAPCSTAIPCPQCQTCNTTTGLCEALAEVTSCGDRCVDTTSDRAHCGACGTACGTGQTCQGSVCGVVCGSQFCPVATQFCGGGTCQACDVCQPEGACAFTSVQAAINATPQLAAIRVCAGTYVENADLEAAVIIDRDLLLIGAGDGADDTANTILHPDHIGQSVVRVFRMGTTLAVTLQAMRITGGKGSPGSMEDAGRGLNLRRSNVTVDTCTIIDNHPTNPAATPPGGGGIRIFDAPCRLSLSNTRVTCNSAVMGGGILARAAQVTLDASSRVTGNTATNGGNSGGGIYADNGAVVALPSAVNVTSNTPNNCTAAGGASFTGLGAVCTAP